MKKIIIHNDTLNERGTSTACYDYAYYLREYLNLTPIIVYNQTAIENNNISIEKFKNQFEVIGYENFQSIEKVIDTVGADYFYWIKYGRNDIPIPTNTKTLIHSVFVSNPDDKHGDCYAVISEWMRRKSNYQLPCVPHMINLPNHQHNIRDEIGIPDDHTVIGRIGGFYTFNVPFAPTVMQRILEKRSDIWFFLMNTPRCVNHERCIYVDLNVDLYDKVTYLNTCDAMLHARMEGETFGLSVLEFASKNKQIISYDNEQIQNSLEYGGRNHFLYLKDNCYKYQDENDLETILLNINRENPFNTEYLNEMFSPKNVIQKFNEVFL